MVLFYKFHILYKNVNNCTIVDQLIVAYPVLAVLAEDTVRRQIHIPEYLAAVRCKFPKSAANTQ